MSDDNQPRTKHIPDEIWPRSLARRHWLLDLLLSDGSVIHDVFVNPQLEAWAQEWPGRGEPGSIRDDFDPFEIVAVKPKEGWRTYAGLRRLFPHRWHYAPGHPETRRNDNDRNA